MINLWEGGPSRFNLNGLGKVLTYMAFFSKDIFSSLFLLRFCKFVMFFCLYFSLNLGEKMFFLLLSFSISKKSSFGPFGSLDRLMLFSMF